MVALICIGWYLCGLVGCALGVSTDLDRGEDFTVHDLLGSVFLGIGGVVVLALGLCVYLTHHMQNSKVLIKGKRK